jgi:hypothetical protein
MDREHKSCRFEAGQTAAPSVILLSFSSPFAAKRIVCQDLCQIKSFANVFNPATKFLRKRVNM